MYSDVQRCTACIRCIAYTIVWRTVCGMYSAERCTAVTRNNDLGLVHAVGHFELSVSLGHTSYGAATGRDRSADVTRPPQPHMQLDLRLEHIF